MHDKLRQDARQTIGVTHTADTISERKVNSGFGDMMRQEVKPKPIVDKPDTSWIDSCYSELAAMIAAKAEKDKNKLRLILCGQCKQSDCSYSSWVDSEGNFVKAGGPLAGGAKGSF